MMKAMKQIWSMHRYFQRQSGRYCPMHKFNGKTSMLPEISRNFVNTRKLITATGSGVSILDADIFHVMAFNRGNVAWINKSIGQCMVKEQQFRSAPSCSSNSSPDPWARLPATPFETSAAEASAASAARAKPRQGKAYGYRPCRYSRTHTSGSTCADTPEADNQKIRTHQSPTHG